MQKICRKEEGKLKTQTFISVTVHSPSERAFTLCGESFFRSKKMDADGMQQPEGCDLLGH